MDSFEKVHLCKIECKADEKRKCSYENSMGQCGYIPNSLLQNYTHNIRTGEVIVVLDEFKKHC